jgi:hypothetical protein
MATRTWSIPMREVNDTSDTARPGLARRLLASWGRLSAAALLCGSLAASLCACGEEFPPASELLTLRVLAVKADQPFAAPGSQPTLEMLAWDGSPRAVQPDGTRRRVRVVWVAGCSNPDGDLYYNCYRGLHQAAAQLSDQDLAAETRPAEAEGIIGYGTTFRPTVPKDIISTRPQPPGVAHPYGLQVVFFLACAGEIRHDPRAASDSDFPLACFEPGSGARLGQEDRVVGYYPLHAYETLKNANPVVSGGTFMGVSDGPSCATTTGCPAGSTCGSEGTCIPVVPACVSDDPDDCPSYAFAPSVDASSVELGVSALVPEQWARSESLWVAYFATAGSFTENGSLIHDAAAGWMQDYQTGWRAWNVKGEARLWAVVHDSRNGVAWWYQDVSVQ